MDVLRGVPAPRVVDGFYLFQPDSPYLSDAMHKRPEFIFNSVISRTLFTSRALIPAINSGLYAEERAEFSVRV
jgi:hypothetical protein